MTLGWNILGILVWLILVLYLIFIVQNIRKRHLIMIFKDLKKFKNIHKLNQPAINAHTMSPLNLTIKKLQFRHILFIVTETE